MKKTNSKRQTSKNGFTLIEVLVTVAVTGILTILASVIFINTVRNSKKTEISAEGRQNAALVIDRLQRDSRNAGNIVVTGTDTITIDSAEGSQIVWRCHPENSPTSNGFIGREVGGVELTVTNRDTIDGVSVKACSFNSQSELVTIDFTINEGVGVQTGPQEYGVSLPFRTSISKRAP